MSGGVRGDGVSTVEALVLIYCAACFVGLVVLYIVSRRRDR